MEVEEEPASPDGRAYHNGASVSTLSPRAIGQLDPKEIPGKEFAVPGTWWRGGGRADRMKWHTARPLQYSSNHNFRKRKASSTNWSSMVSMRAPAVSFELVSDDANADGEPRKWWMTYAQFVEYCEEGLSRGGKGNKGGGGGSPVSLLERSFKEGVCVATGPGVSHLCLQREWTLCKQGG